jgi:putative endonuclease
MAAAREARGRAAQARGVAAEEACAGMLARAGFHVLARRIRTGAGEIDILARRGALTLVIEVKARPRAEEAAFAISPRQRARLAAAAEALMADEPGWFGEGLRFDAMLVGADGEVRWIEDAFRPGD